MSTEERGVSLVGNGELRLQTLQGHTFNFVGLIKGGIRIEYTEELMNDGEVSGKDKLVISTNLRCKDLSEFAKAMGCAFEGGKLTQSPDSVTARVLVFKIPAPVGPGMRRHTFWKSTLMHSTRVPFVDSGEEVVELKFIAHADLSKPASLRFGEAEDCLTV
jgi:hypothetical protein